MQLSSQSNESIQTVDLQALSKIHSDQEPVFSLYLDLRPDKQNAKDLLLRFENLLRQTEQQKKLDQDPSAYKQRWAGEAEQGTRLAQDSPTRPGARPGCIHESGCRPLENIPLACPGI